MQREHACGAEFASGALVGLGRIGVAVAKDDRASIERGTDNLRNGLCPIGEHQAQLCARIKRIAAGMGEQAADTFAQPGAAGLACSDNVLATSKKPFVEFTELRGLA